MARQAFKYATGEDVGNDPDAMRKWWKEHEKGFNFEAAGLRRAKEGGGPTAKDGDGSRPTRERNRPSDARAGRAPRRARLDGQPSSTRRVETSVFRPSATTFVVGCLRITYPSPS